MRIILKKLVSATSLSIRRYAVRFSSTDAQSSEKKVPEEKIDDVKKSKVIFLENNLRI